MCDDSRQGKSTGSKTFAQPGQSTKLPNDLQIKEKGQVSDKGLAGVISTGLG